MKYKAKMKYLGKVKSTNGLTLKGQKLIIWEHRVHYDNGARSFNVRVEEMFDGRLRACAGPGGNAPASTAAEWASDAEQLVAEALLVEGGLA